MRCRPSPPPCETASAPATSPTGWTPTSWRPSWPRAQPRSAKPSSPVSRPPASPPSPTASPPTPMSARTRRRCSSSPASAPAPTPNPRSGEGEAVSVADAAALLVEALDLQRAVLAQHALLLLGVGLVVGVGGDEDLALGHLVVGQLPVLALVDGADAAGHAADRTAGDGAAERGRPDADADARTDARDHERHTPGDGAGHAPDGAALGHVLADVADQVGVALACLELGRRLLGVPAAQRHVVAVDAGRRDGLE